MKKIYINPVMEIVKVKAQQLLSGSIPGGGNTDQNLTHEDDYDW